MKKKNMFIVPICAVVLMGVFVVSVYATTADGKLDSKPAANVIDVADEQIAVSVDFSEEISKRYKADGNALTNEQIQKIAQLYHNQNLDPALNRLPYQEGIITGEVDPDAPKLDLAAVKDIIARADGFEEIMSEFNKIQEYPDYVGGSGVSIYVYHFSKYDGIVILYEQEEINYQTFNPDGTLKSSEMLFG